MSSSFRFGSSQLCLFQYAAFWNGSPARHATVRGRATAPRPPHTAALGEERAPTPISASGERGKLLGGRPLVPVEACNTFIMEIPASGYFALFRKFKRIKRKVSNFRFGHLLPFPCTRGDKRTCIRRKSNSLDFGWRRGSRHKIRGSLDLTESVTRWCRARRG